MKKKVLIMIAEGSEAVEIVVPADVLRIGGIDVTIASIHGKHPVTVTGGIHIVPDASLYEVDKDGYDVVMMPGGVGHVNLEKNDLVGEILRNQYKKGKIVAAICSGPKVFLAHGIGYGNKLTSYPPEKEALKEQYEYLEDAVIQDKNMITSRGPATVYAFTCKIAENLLGVEKAKEMAERNLYFDLY
jgi:DJ-1 family protein